MAGQGGKSLRNWVRVGVGVLLVWAALGVVGYRTGWMIHFQHARAALLRSANDAAAPGAGSCGASAKDRQLTGVLQLPALGVTAPVAQGTEDDVLGAAVGHASSTPLPGSPGTAVLLAHDVSYFSHIDALKPGDLIRYTSACSTDVFTVTGHTVVRAGAPVPALGGDALVLDTCWPTDALWFTPNRYLVEAVQTSTARAAPTTSNSGFTTWVTAYHSPAPPPLVAQGLDLVHNEVPMGTLQLAGSPDPHWAQSPAPLAVEGAALQAYFGATHAAAQRRQDWWSLVAPGVAPPPEIWGTWVSAHEAPLGVRLSATGDTPTSVTFDTVVQLSGGAAPGVYHEQVSEAVHGLVVTVTSWEVNHA